MHMHLKPHVRYAISQPPACRAWCFLKLWHLFVMGLGIPKLPSRHAQNHVVSRVLKKCHLGLTNQLLLNFFRIHQASTKFQTF